MLEPAGDDDLLLVAARQGLDRPRRLVRADAEAPADRQRLGGLGLAGCRQWPSRARRVAAGLRNRFSRTLSGMARLSPVRSPATKPMPAAMARPGVARSGAEPCSRITPASIGHEAEQGPADRLLAGAAQADQAHHLAAVHGQRNRAGLAGDKAVDLDRRRIGGGLRADEDLLGGRPTISRISSGGVVSATRPRPTRRPSRSTATSSASSNTSSSRCET